MGYFYDSRFTRKRLNGTVQTVTVAGGVVRGFYQKKVRDQATVGGSGSATQRSAKRKGNKQQLGYKHGYILPATATATKCENIYGCTAQKRASGFSAVSDIELLRWKSATPADLKML